jgi:hypothetical protein
VYETSAFAGSVDCVWCLMFIARGAPLLCCSADDEEAGSGAGCGREAISERVLGGRARGGVPYF